MDTRYVERARHTSHIVRQIRHSVGLIHVVTIANITEVHRERAILFAEDGKLVAPSLPLGPQPGEQDDRSLWLRWADLIVGQASPGDLHKGWWREFHSGDSLLAGVR